jgi:hypothetical protein
MPSTTHVLGPLKAKSLNHTPTPAVNPDLSETDGWQARAQTMFQDEPETSDHDYYIGKARRRRKMTLMKWKFPASTPTVE